MWTPLLTVSLAIVQGPVMWTPLLTIVHGAVMWTPLLTVSLAIVQGVCGGGWLPAAGGGRAVQRCRHDHHSQGWNSVLQEATSTQQDVNTALAL